jgi:hypothetical protein
LLLRTANRQVRGVTDAAKLPHAEFSILKQRRSNILKLIYWRHVLLLKIGKRSVQSFTLFFVFSEAGCASIIEICQFNLSANTKSKTEIHYCS